MERAVSKTNAISHHTKEESEIKVDEKQYPSDFDNFVPWACKEFSLSDNVIITRGLHKPYVSTASMKASKSKSKRTSRALVPSMDSCDYLSGLFSLDHYDDENVNKITIETYYNNNEHLIQIRFSNNKIIPRILMQVIGLTIPYQKHLTSIKINSGLNAAALHELCKFLPISQITELCLDHTFLSEANYHTVLSTNKLKHLSLSNCKINDAVVSLISSQLVILTPASKMLSALNLSSNRITDVGMEYIADMLRSNRRLCYLNLSDNLITDDGGLLIINVLGKFPTKPQEIHDSRVRFVEYLKQKKEFVDVYVKDLQESRKSDKSPPKKKAGLKINETDKTENITEAQMLQSRAELLAEHTLGLFHDPFSLNNTVTEGSVVHCLGNNTLCYLNLAYNRLTYITLQRLHEVIREQKRQNRTPRGLIKVVIEGNPMPSTCHEYDEINILLGVMAPRMTMIHNKKKSVIQNRSTARN